ncbi:uncharacterized protein LOC116169144 [Photinus pyralis]|nr:uncharacterized protein LOC116169144 [Photinus pyralis]
MTINAHSLRSEPYVILSTAKINLRGARGNIISCRALLDSGSQSNFVTRELFERLGLKGSKINMCIGGIDKSTTNITTQITTEISSVHNGFKRELTFLVLRDITGKVPISDIDISNIEIPNGIDLADQEFNVSAKIDVLLGAGVFWNLLCIGQVKLENHDVILQKTRLGWVFAGSVSHSKTEINALHSINQDVQNQLEKFWKIEECDAPRQLTDEEAFCERHFTENYKRDSTGRFVVRLPMRDENFDFKNSLDSATRRFLSLEKRFSRDPIFKGSYHDFIREYENLGHMSEVKRTMENNDYHPIFYLPHHGVIKNSSATTKLRVVFDASCKSSSGWSLNEKLCVGPHIQDDLFSIITRFRKHNIVYTADIEKMYRQIMVADDQRDLQRIVWRSHESEPLRYYKLNTVTYGTAPASFLAVRCLRQLGLDNLDTSPKASGAIINDFYMDDLLTGTETIEEAIETKEHINEILSGAGFKLRKWSSNHTLLLQDSDSKRQEDHYCISDDKGTKTLGLMWDNNRDTIGYSLSFDVNENKVTKRTILSIVAKIFDPLGLLGPITVKIKIILQRLWSEQLNWDESVPLHIYTEWKRIVNSLKNIENVRLPRQVTIQNYTELELHGFCDASEAAYACCVYIRSKDKEGNIKCNLLCAKSRVAPLKTITIPKLELCGAVLLANLMYKLNSIEWKFIPSRSPHFGGFYEAAIKSAKSIMKRIVGNAHLTFEQLTTVFVQIESVLNSRPMTPISSDPNDLLALTPGHFLIGDVLNCIPQEHVIDTPENRLNHYERLNQMFQQFWKRWTSEYTHTLQARGKWNKQRPDIKIGAMVLLKGESTPPLLWPLGRVVELHPGSDKVTRVVTVKTGSGLVKRAVAKLCILPINEE